MKNTLIALILLSLGLSFLSLKGDKETLVDIIAKHDKILVAVDLYSKIVRNPSLGEAKDNEEQVPGDMQKKFMTSIVAKLNEGFKTDKFQYYKGERVNKDMMREKELEFFVIVTFSGRYTMSEAMNSDNLYTYRYHMGITENFYGFNAKGKLKVLSSGPSINADCPTFTSPIKAMKLQGMYINCRPQCIETKLMEQIEKKNKKFTAKQLAKAAK